MVANLSPLGCYAVHGQQVGVSLRCWALSRCCCNVSTLATFVTYFLGLVRTTQRHTRGVSWLFITNNSLLAVIQLFRRAVFGCNTVVWDNNKPGRAACKRKLVSWTACKFPVSSGYCLFLFGLLAGESLVFLAPVPPGPWHRAGQAGVLSYWSRLLSVVCVGSRGISHTRRWRRLRCVLFVWRLLRIDDKPWSAARSVWVVKCELSEMSSRSGWEGRKRGGSLPWCQVYVNHGAVQFQTYLPTQRSPHRICSEPNYDQIVTNLTIEGSQPTANSLR